MTDCCPGTLNPVSPMRLLTPALVAFTMLLALLWPELELTGTTSIRARTAS